jgi:hypothetical protein
MGMKEANVLGAHPELEPFCTLAGESAKPITPLHKEL